MSPVLVHLTSLGQILGDSHPLSLWDRGTSTLQKNIFRIVLLQAQLSPHKILVALTPDTTTKAFRHSPPTMNKGNPPYEGNIFCT